MSGEATYEEEFESVTEWAESEAAHQEAKPTKTRLGPRKRRNRAKSEEGNAYAFLDALGDLGEVLRLHKEVMRVVGIHRWHLDEPERWDLAWDLLHESAVYLSRQKSGFQEGDYYNNGYRLLKQAKRLLNHPTPLGKETIEAHPGRLVEALDLDFRTSGTADGPTERDPEDDNGGADKGIRPRHGTRARQPVEETYEEAVFGFRIGSDIHLDAIIAGTSVERLKETRLVERERQGKREAEKVGGVSGRGPVPKPDSEVSKRTLQRREARRRKRKREAEKLTTDTQKWRIEHPEKP